jgi:hypothetical protein
MELDYSGAKPVDVIVEISDMEAFALSVINSPFFSKCRKAFYENRNNGEYDLTVTASDNGVDISYVDMDMEFPETRFWVYISGDTGDIFRRRGQTVAVGNILIEAEYENIVAALGLGE